MASVLELLTMQTFKNKYQHTHNVHTTIMAFFYTKITKMFCFGMIRLMR